MASPTRNQPSPFSSASTARNREDLFQKKEEVPDERTRMNEVSWRDTAHKVIDKTAPVSKASSTVGSTAAVKAVEAATSITPHKDALAPVFAAATAAIPSVVEAATPACMGATHYVTDKSMDGAEYSAGKAKGAANYSLGRS